MTQAAQDQAIIAGNDLAITNNVTTVTNSLDGGAINSAFDFVRQNQGAAYDFSESVSDGAFRFVRQNQGAAYDFSESVSDGAFRLVRQNQGAAYDFSESVSDGAFRLAYLSGENNIATVTETLGFGLQALSRMENVTHTALDTVTRANDKAISASTEAAGMAEKEISRAYDQANNRDFNSVETLVKNGLIALTIVAGLFFFKGGKA
ncbi:MAG: hypothetical protein ACYCX5_12555 [Coriobacteriia bacterium]